MASGGYAFLVQRNFTHSQVGERVFVVSLYLTFGNIHERTWIVAMTRSLGELLRGSQVTNQVEILRTLHRKLRVDIKNIPGDLIPINMLLANNIARLATIPRLDHLDQLGATITCMNGRLDHTR